MPEWPMVAERMVAAESVVLDAHPGGERWIHMKGPLSSGLCWPRTATCEWGAVEGEGSDVLTGHLFIRLSHHKVGNWGKGHCPACCGVGLADDHMCLNVVVVFSQTNAGFPVPSNSSALWLHTDSVPASGDVLSLGGTRGAVKFSQVSGWGLELVLCRGGRRDP